MAQDIFSKLNPLDDEFWSEEPEEKLQKMTYLGYGGVGLAFFSLLLALFGGEDFYLAEFIGVIFSTFLIPTCPTYWDAYSEFCWHFGSYSDYFPLFGTLYFPIVTGMFLINVFAKRSINQTDKIIGGLLIFMLFKDVIVILFELELWLETFAYDIWNFIGFIAEVGVIIILLSVVMSLVFSSKLYSDKIFIYSLISLFFILLLITLKGILTWFSDDISSSPSDYPVYFLYVISLPISLGLFFYSIACLYSYRYNIEPWGEEENPYGYGQLPPETPANVGISVANASKLKEAKELLDQGILDEKEFQKIKDEYFPK